MLLEDLGTEQYLAALQDRSRADVLYGEALGALCTLQLRGGDAAAQLSPYDDAVLQRELELMPEWFAVQHLDLVLTEEDRGVLATAFKMLREEALAQPVAFVHRDYHSRNLMVLPAAGPGIIDFQDALVGPVCYDLVSLLKDCYIRWPRAQVEAWLRGHRAALSHQISWRAWHHTWRNHRRRRNLRFTKQSDVVGTAIHCSTYRHNSWLARLRLGMRSPKLPHTIFHPF
jgi:aminoglycoside/choline kinase family phosphotransferase